jgi:molybdate/tungstate transport system substrate-binding protein
MRAFLLLALVLAVASCAQQTSDVSVLYAGSLVTPMEGHVARALARSGVTFEGEPLGSKEIANLIVAGLRRPDAVILVDPSVEAVLARRGLILRWWSLGTTSLGLAWSQKSRLAARGPQTVRGLLTSRGLRIARTDPRLDPKGAYTIEAVRMLLGAAGERDVLGADDNPAQTFPEESLLVRLETGEADVGFVYKTEAIARHLHFLALPGRASLSGKILYTLAILKAAPHPAAARAFSAFLLRGPGRAILERAGVTR